MTADERNQISQSLSTYCRGLDGFDRDLAPSPFAAKARSVYSRNFEGTVNQFIDWIWPIHARVLVLVHRVVNIYIERPGGDLVRESDVQVLLRAANSADGSITDNIGNGRYIDRWAQLHGGLVIVERDYVRDATRAYPHHQSEVAARRPASNGTAFTSPRGESDAAYRLLRA